MVNTPEKTRSRQELEFEMLHRQQILAASSTDDITLLSKKKRPVGKTRSHDIPYQAIPDYSSPSPDLPFSKQHRPTNSFTLGATPPPSLPAKREILVKATDIDTGMSVMVPSNESSKMEKRSSSSKAPYASPAREKLIQPASNRRPITVVHIHTKSLDEETQVSSSSNRKHRNSSTSPPSEGNEVTRLRDKFEGLLSQPPASPKKPEVVSTQSHSQTRTGIARRSSTENSDSGRESMLDSADNVIPAAFQHN